MFSRESVRTGSILHAFQWKYSGYQNLVQYKVIMTSVSLKYENEDISGGCILHGYSIQWVRNAAFVIFKHVSNLL